MTAQQIIHRLDSEGIRYRLDGDKIVLTPAERVTDEIKTLILAERPAVKMAIQERHHRATGYGCGRCGNKVYTQVPAGWQCDGCGMIFEIIGGSRGPRPITEVTQ